MSASCRIVEQAVTRRLDDRRDPALWLVETPGDPVGEIEAIRRHLDACPHCRASWENAQRLAHASTALARRTARVAETLGSPEFVERVWTAWRDAEKTTAAPLIVVGRVGSQEKRRWAVGMALVWAAVLVLAVGLGWRLGARLSGVGEKVDPASPNLAGRQVGSDRPTSASAMATVAVDRELVRVTTATLGLVRRASEPAARVGRDLLEVSRVLPETPGSSSTPRFHLLPLKGWNGTESSSLESGGQDSGEPEPQAVALADLGTRVPSATVSAQTEDSWAVPALRAFRFVLPHADVSSTHKDHD